MKVTFKGVVKDIPANYAKDLISRGVAKEVKETEPEKKVVRKRKTKEG